MTSVLETEAPRDAVRAVRASVLALSALVALKFAALLAEFDWDAARAPWGLLVIITVPTLAVLLLARSHPRAAAGLALPLLLLWGLAVVLAIASTGFVRQSWADYPAAYLGLLVSAWGGWAAVRVLRGR